MEKANPVYLSNSIASKLCNLLGVLQNATVEFDVAAKNIEDKQMQRTVLSLAVESNQYAKELSSHLHSMGMNNLETAHQCDCHDLIDHMHHFADGHCEAVKLEAWKNSENYFVTAYRNVLNEYFPFPSLRTLVNYQLNGMKLAFMKMKLLNELMYR